MAGRFRTAGRVRQIGWVFRHGWGLCVLGSRGPWMVRPHGRGRGLVDVWGRSIIEGHSYACGASCRPTLRRCSDLEGHVDPCRLIQARWRVTRSAVLEGPVDLLGFVRRSILERRSNLEGHTNVGRCKGPVDAWRGSGRSVVRGCSTLEEHVVLRGTSCRPIEAMSSLIRLLLPPGRLEGHVVTGRASRRQVEAA